MLACACALIGAAILPAHALAHPGYDASIHAASEEVAAHPHDRAVRLKRVELYRRAGHLHDALSDLRVLAREDPNDPAMLVERALVLIAQGRSRAAERDLDAAIALGSTSITARWERAKLRERAGRLDEAREDLDAAITLGGTPDLYLDLARVHAARGDLDAAASTLAAGCDALSDAVVLRLRLVQVHRERDRPAEALAELDGLLDRAPGRADWVLLRGELLDDLSRPAEALGERLRALALANAAIARRPTALHRLSRARVYLALHLPHAAIDDLQRVAAIAPDLPEAHALLRRAKEALG